MLSFIIIGKNEGKNLTACISSCISFAYNIAIDYEIIYVDSQSTDNSLAIASNFNKVKTLILQSPCNAAKARNLGARNAEGDYFVFVDGDMVLYPEFGNKIIKNGELIYPFLNGQRIDIYYDENGRFLSDTKNEVTKIKNDKYLITTGGLYIIKRTLWHQMNGMDSKLRCFEDNDLAYRIYLKKNIKILNVGSIFAEHHTIGYTNKKRYIDLARGNNFLFKGVIFRKYIFSKILIYLVRKNLSFFSLLLAIFLTAIIQNPSFLLLYVMVLSIKMFFIRKTNDSIPKIKRFFVDGYIDFKILYGLLFFYPKK
ncbi:glycosyltransferase [Mariniphaga sediminis]|uniref:Glycosyltransferase n=1 Tax=Mariniphaga sediminis TaxID=1628158 RepID=A0A399CYU5_9BACT|nr:glycosyltransferase [Mariniphaga sediminis]RIH63240.1 glycosyltransferase [Mariniphaga sediminis]